MCGCVDGLMGCFCVLIRFFGSCLLSGFNWYELCFFFIFSGIDNVDFDFVLCVMCESFWKVYY